MLSGENERADPGRDGRTYFARPKSQLRVVTEIVMVKANASTRSNREKNIFPVRLTTRRIVNQARKIIFPVKLTTSRIVNQARLTPNLRNGITNNSVALALRYRRKHAGVRRRYSSQQAS